MSPIPAKNRHELVVVPEEACADLEARVAALEAVHPRAKEISFAALPAFYREQPAWRALVAHGLAGARRSWSHEPAAAALGAALSERTAFDWSWLDGMAHFVSPDEAAAAASELAELAAEPGGPCAVVMAALARFGREDERQGEWRAGVEQMLARPDGVDRGPPTEIVELLRNLFAAFHDAARHGEGLLYLTVRPEL